MADPYSVLGVAKTATTEEIRAAYRRLAKQSHPDLHPGDKKAEERFKQISAAHDLLSDAEKRRRFDAGEIDAQGQERPQQQFYRDFAGGAGGRKYDRVWSEDELSGLGGVFSDLFGRAGRDGGFAGASLTFTLQVPFLAAARGGRQRVALPDGRTLEIDIPEGAQDGQMLRLKGQGAAMKRDGPRGDAFVELRVEPHPFFERRGPDVHMELPVTIGEAVLGGRIEVPTVGGAVMLTIPAGSNTGSTLRLKGRGILDQASGRRGDHYVRLRVVLPERTDPQLKAFLEQWEAGKAHNPRRHLQQA
jgi:DnaJ-class molecular chaperone